MGKKVPIPVFSVLVGPAEYLLQNSEDYLLEMGLLHYLYTCRPFHGSEWTWVPINDLATRGKMGYRRVKSALDRLVSLGFVEHYERPGAYGSLMHYYRIPRVDEELLEEWTIHVPDSVQDHSLKKPLKIEPPKNVALMYDYVKSWSGNGYPFIEEYDKDFARKQFPTCPECEMFYEPKYATAPDGSGLCVECWMRHRWEEGQREFDIGDEHYEFDEFPEIRLP